MKYLYKNIVIIVFLFFVNVTVFAQETDSIYTRQYQLREIFWKQFIQNPNVQQNLSLADFTETSLYIEIKKSTFINKTKP